MFLPSLLEYSLESFESRLNLINSDIARYNLLSQNPQPDTISLHLDFVLSQFAKDRFVMKSLNPQSVTQVLDKNFADKKLDLSIHLMGEVQDLFDSYLFFQNYKFNPNWKYRIFIPEKYFFSWSTADFINYNQNTEVGVWYDLNQWETVNFQIADSFLLMTVLAGKSGQKLTPEISGKVLSVVQNNQNKNFILDGGWSLETKAMPKNCNLVSYSSFWKQFETGII